MTRLAIAALVATVPVLLMTQPAIATDGLVGACKTKNYTTADIDPVQYSGVWFELARSKSFIFDNGCLCTQATYGVIDAATLSVNNSCRKDSPSAQVTAVLGNATIPDPAHPGHLEVTQGGAPFPAPYDVVLVGKDYAFTVIVSCFDFILQYSNVWILAREPTMPAQQMADIQATISKMGFDLSDLIMTQQGGGCWNGTQVALRGAVALQ